MGLGADRPPTARTHALPDPSGGHRVFRVRLSADVVFTSKTGDALRKAPDKLKNELIKEHLLRTAVEHTSRSPPSSGAAAVEPAAAQGLKGRARMLSEDEVSGLLKAEGGGGLLDGMLGAAARAVARRLEYAAARGGAPGPHR